MAEISSSWLLALEKPVNEVIREQENKNKNILNDGPKHELERKFEISDQSSLKFSPLKTGQMRETPYLFTNLSQEKTKLIADHRDPFLS